jgi:hypothetical protein
MDLTKRLQSIEEFIYEIACLLPNFAVLSAFAVSMSTVRREERGVYRQGWF